MLWIYVIFIQAMMQHAVHASNDKKNRINLIRFPNVGTDYTMPNINASQIHNVQSDSKPLVVPQPQVLQDILQPTIAASPKQTLQNTLPQAPINEPLATNNIEPIKQVEKNATKKADTAILYPKMNVAYTVDSETKLILIFLSILLLILVISTTLKFCENMLKIGLDRHISKEDKIEI